MRSPWNPVSDFVRQFFPNDRAKQASQSSQPWMSRLQQNLRGTAGQFSQRYAQQQQARQGSVADDYIQQLYDALYGGTSDMGALQSQASSQAAGIFGPQIEAIRNIMRQQEEQAARNKVDIGNLFTSLSGDISADIPKIAATTAEGKSAVAKQYETSQQATANLYDQIQQEQMDLYKKLNIQAAAPEAMAQQGSDEAFFRSLMEAQSGQTQDYLGTIGAGSEEFTRQGAQLAQVEGTQRQSDIMTQLADLMSGYQSDIAGLQSQQSVAASDILNQLLGQESQSRQQNFENLLDMARFKEGIRQFEVGQAEGPEEDLTYEGIRGMRNVAEEYFGKGSAQASKVSSWVGNWLTEGYERDPFGSADPNKAAREAVEAAREAGFSQGALVAIRDSVLAYFGRY